MSAGRDYLIVYKINQHYDELKTIFLKINSLEEFCNGGTTRKAILFDLIQIGELLNHLTPGFRTVLDTTDVKYAVGLRNVIVHDYARIDDEVIYDTIRNDLAPFIENMNDIAKKRYVQNLNNLIGKEVHVLISKKIDSNTYEGFTQSLTSLDGWFQTVHVKMSTEKKIIYATIDEIKQVDNKLILIGHEK